MCKELYLYFLSEGKCPVVYTHTQVHACTPISQAELKTTVGTLKFSHPHPFPPSVGNQGLESPESTLSSQWKGRRLNPPKA